MGQEPSGRGYRLTRELVVAAALRIVDRDGLKGLTMRALGRELGVDPMAVYHWVPSKDRLLDLIVDAVFSEIPLDGLQLPEGDWSLRFTYAARVFRDTLVRHPNALAVLATRPGMSEAAVAPAEFAIGLLREAGFALETAVYAVGVMSNFVVGLVLAEVGLPPGAAEDMSPQDQVAAMAALPSEGFPNNTAMLAMEYDFDRQFELGMSWIVAGMEPLRTEAGETR
jgi:TetR/AcrR family transcriptional regulator, tetracycline repressor protein